MPSFPQAIDEKRSCGAGRAILHLSSFILHASFFILYGSLDRFSLLSLYFASFIFHPPYIGWLGMWRGQGERKSPGNVHCFARV
jgi:hypothetical protein